MFMIIYTLQVQYVCKSACIKDTTGNKSVRNVSAVFLVATVHTLVHTHTHTHRVM